MADDRPRRGRQAAVCPICGRPREPRFKPFCSARCRDQDLLNWLGGRYAITAEEVEPDEDDTVDDQPG